MKKLYLLCCLQLFVAQIQAQNYSNLLITSGFNEDVIAENSPASTYTTAAVDATSSYANNAFMSINYPNATVGLPANGLITSIATATPGLTFQLAPYDQNNSLKINADNGTGTLAVQTTAKISKLYILTTSGSSSSTFTGRITFTDQTIQDFDYQSVPDWYDQGTPAIAIRGIGRVPRTGIQNPDNNTTNPKLFQVAIDISSTNQNKIIQQVSITKTSSTSGFLNIFALSGEITQTCIKPDALGIQNLTATSVDLTWTSPGTTFDIKWGERNFNVTTAGTLVTGFANGGTLSGLTADTNYDYYVRRDCGAVDGVSAWAGPFQFRTGYCIPTGATNNSDEIRNFKLSNLNNNSTASEGTAGYKDYSGTVEPAILEIGEAYVASLTSGSGSGTHGTAIWIDYNNNLIFEANEKVSIIGNTISPSTTVNFPSFTVPATIQPGIYRLRVQYQYNKSGADLDPCTIISNFAETEDYAVQIMPAPTCFPPLNVTAQRITKNSAQVVWEAPILGNPPALGYKIEVRTSGHPGDASGLVQTLTTTNLSQTITGLSVETEYLIYVQSLCATTDESTWSRIAFTTLCNYPDYELTTSASDLSFCGPHEVTLEVNTQGIVNWYNSATSTTPIHSGNTFTTTVSATSSFWYQVSSLESTGPLNAAAVSTTSGNWSTEWDVYFTIFEPTKLKSIDIYPSTAGQTGRMIFKQRGATGSATVGTIDYTTVGANRTVKQVVPIDLQLLPGTYVIETTLPSDGMLRNTNGASYPYSSGVASITGNKYLPSYYMGYYNWIFETGCTSPRTEVVATINPIPDAPTAIDQQFCIAENATIANLVATGTDVKWYASLTSTNVLALTDVLTSGSYFATQTLNGCESISRKEVQVTINETLAPTAIDQQFCIAENATIANLVATGTDVKWYASLTSTNVLALTDVLTTGSYFATQTLNGCESISRKEVQVTINETLAPTAIDQQFCIAENATIANLVATGTDVKWYASLTSTNVLALTDVLTTGSYFATQTLNGCESISRKEVQVTINETPAPTAVDQQFCIAENATIANLVATGTDLKWYSSLTSTNALALTDVLTSGSYFATQTLNGCESISRKEVQVTINETLAPTAIDQQFCIAENATIANLVATGTDVKWYASLTSTNVLALTDVLTSGSYFATQTLNGCESISRKEVQVTINETHAPTAIDQQFCIAENATIANLVATGTDVKWYNSLTSTNALALTDVLTSGSYFATQTLNGCESISRKEVQVTINNTAAPTAIDQQFCIAENATIANLVATGTDLKWYTSLTSTNALALTDVLTSGSYFATQTLNGCESVSRKEVQVTINETLAPTAIDQQFCIAENATIANLVATGTDLKWYTSLTSTNALALTDVLTSGSYFATQTLNGCESISRKEVQVTINETLAPTAIDQQFCIAENATIANLVATGTDIKWYNSLTSTNALALTDVLTSGSYFATQTLNGCESISRKEVQVTINETLAPTAIDQQFCIAENATIANLVATGTDVKWYTSLTSTNALALTDVLTSGSYFATQTLNGCESISRKKVQVTINNTAAPTATAIQEFCSNASHKISDLVITGTDIKWYETATSTTALNTNTNLINGLTYYATQTLNGCESTNRVQVQAQVSTPPNLPTGDSIQTFCGNATIADLEIVGLTGAELIWYQSQFSNTTLPASTTLTNATYYVAQKVGACISDRKPVTARIINLNPPNVGSFEFCGSAKIADLYIPAPTGVTYKWYNSPSNPNELQPNTALSTGTYFVAKKQYNCETERSVVSVVIKDLPNSPTGVSPQTFIEGTTLNQIIVNPTTAVYYITEEDARTNTNPLSENMPLVNGTTYYAVNIGTNGCPSLPLPITIEVYLSNNEFEKDKLKYYPNPVNNKLNIDYFENIVQIDVYDLLGRNIKTVQTNDRNVEIDLSELSSATYMIQLKTESKQQFIKIIKN